ncbi:hypothetical protein OS965_02400 [Streptomyces sp. H27-G5]|uniref:hypothetical protein n=1 Tax=Streptomyces sp. H27-G5 TaxID=2996698 RepID=UPI00227193BD|nr:hypothetical protein [Streptomyces sp. H27-G5]MCY0917027.1 hypothetical protein [Streptomyces sp. H27-G5]
MGVSYMIKGGSEQECRQALDELCRAVGAVPTILPTDQHGGSWIARAVPTTKAPAGGEGLSVGRWVSCCG